MYQFGDVVLIAFPFTDLSETKKRPALVVLDADDNDVLVARINSRRVGSDKD